MKNKFAQINELVFNYRVLNLEEKHLHLQSPLELYSHAKILSFQLAHAETLIFTVTKFEDFEKLFLVDKAHRLLTLFLTFSTRNPEF